MPARSKFPAVVGMKERMRRAWAQVRRESGYRSGYEKAVAEALAEVVPAACYEAASLRYEVRAWRRYIPDFLLPEQAIVIEAKGQFMAADRAKMLIIKRRYPRLDIRLLFQRPNDLISKNMRAGDWCDKHGFPFAKGPDIPEAWVVHRPSPTARAAFDACFSSQLFAGGDRR